MIEQVVAWDAAGRPFSEGLQVRVYPHEADYNWGADEFVIDKRGTQIAVR